MLLHILFTGVSFGVITNLGRGAKRHSCSMVSGVLDRLITHLLVVSLDCFMPSFALFSQTSCFEWPLVFCSNPQVTLPHLIISR